MSRKRTANPRLALREPSWENLSRPPYKNSTGCTGYSLTAAVFVRRMRTKRIRRKRPGPARRGRIVDLARLAWMAEIAVCAVAFFIPGLAHQCGNGITTHHVRDFGSPKDDTKTIRLCGNHHQIQCGPHAIEHGKKQFEENTGLSIAQLVQYYRDQYESQGTDCHTEIEGPGLRRSDLE